MMNIKLEDLPPKMREQAERKLADLSRGKSPVDKLVDFDQKSGSRSDKCLTGASQDKGSRRKYGNKTCEVNGVQFDSKKEARRYEELMGFLQAGWITDLKLQHHFTLAEAFKMPDGTPIRKMEYIADFTYTDGEGRFIVEDVKSEATRKNPVYAIKKKLMAHEGYKITEV